MAQGRDSAGRFTSGSSVVVRFIGDDTSLGRSLVKLQAMARKTQDALGKLGDKSKPAFAAITTGAKAAASALKLLAAGGAAQGLLGGVIGAVTQLSGAALLIPAAVGVAGAALATFKLGMSGFADAVKSGDLSKLAPQAREVATEIRAMAPEFEKLKMSTQNALFSELGLRIKALGQDYFPILQKQLPEIAHGFNDMAHGLLDALKAPVVKNSINEVLANTAKLLQGMPNALGNFASGFAILAGAGSKHLTPIGGMIEKISDKFNHWADGFVKSGAFDAAVKSAEAGFKDLWEVAKNVGSAVGSIWTALQAGGSAADKAAGGNGEGGPLGFLKSMSKALADTFAKPEIQAGIKALGQAMADVAGAGGGALLSLINFLVPLFKDAQPVISDVAKTLGQVLRDAIAQLGPSIKEFLAWFLPWVDRQLPKIADIISNYILPAIRSLIDFLSEHKEAVKVFFAGALVVIGLLAAPIGVVGLAIAGLALGFIAAFDVIKTVVTTVFKFIIETIGLIIGGIADFLEVLGHIPGPAGQAFGAAGAAARSAQEKVMGLVGGIDQVKPKTVEVKQMGAEGAKSAVDALGKGIRDLKDKTVTINYVVNGAGSFIPKRAVGGTVNKGQTYLVGERGPELMTMPGSGSITPNHKMGGAVGGGSGGGVTINFGGQTDGAFAAAFMKLVRTGAIQIQGA